MMSALLAAFVAWIALAVAASLPEISAVGSKFFTADGAQFYIKGYSNELYIRVQEP